MKPAVNSSSPRNPDDPDSRRVSWGLTVDGGRIRLTVGRRSIALESDGRGRLVTPELVRTLLEDEPT